MNEDRSAREAGLLPGPVWIIVLVLLAWVPLFVLSAWAGVAWGGRVKLPFLHDIEVHVRLLVSLPLLLLAERFVRLRVVPLVRQFPASGLVADEARPQFERAVGSAFRRMNSALANIVIIALVYGVGVFFIWRNHSALSVDTWYGVAAGGRLEPTLSGWWLGLVSLPLVQFLLLRWYYRLGIGARFLWQVSRMRLNVMPLHPDGSGGLGFLALVNAVVVPVVLAQGALLAGRMSNRFFYGDGRFSNFQMEWIGLMAVVVLAVLGPLLVFAPRLAAAKRAAIVEYGLLAHRYTREFDAKWLRGGAPAGEPLIGSPDIQSLADLSSSHAVVSGMRLVPFTLQTVVQLAALTSLPVLPLLLAMVPLDELISRLLKLVA